MTMPQSVRPSAAPAPERLSRYVACLLGGAVGDALGAPVEFMSRHEILRRFGPGGIRDHASAYGRTGAITDDTQMTLFTAEGLLRAAAQGHPPGHAAYIAEVAQAYQRWLLTQDEDPAAHAGAEGLLGIAALHSRRAPATTLPGRAAPGGSPQQLQRLRRRDARGARRVVARAADRGPGSPGARGLHAGRRRWLRSPTVIPAAACPPACSRR